MNPSQVKHPSYSEMVDQWKKWRLAYEGGEKFKNEYLLPRSGERNFSERYDVSYIPAFAKSAIVEIARSMHQRVSKVIRSGGGGSYLKVANGELNGIDRANSTLNSFIGRQVVNELLAMGKVGIYVDNVVPNGPTKADIQPKDHPYIYLYRCEAIRDWAYMPNDPAALRYVVLEDRIEKFNAEGLREKTVSRYRVLMRTDSGVSVQFYDESGKPTDRDGNPGGPILLDIPEIPLVVIDLGMSFMSDVADHQIALMVLASCDMNYAVKSNIPFYTEQRDLFSSDLFTKQLKGWPRDAEGNYIDAEDLSEEERATYEKASNTLEVGNSAGRAYGKGLERPAFIHPSPEPLQISMDKQQRIKEEIRELSGLALKQLGLRYQSSESKEKDFEPMEAGISYIGLILEAGENAIANIYAAYESTTPAFIKYPINYQLLSDADRRKACSEDAVIARKVPAETFRKEVQKQIARTRLEHIVAPETMSIIMAEIDSAKAPTVDPEEMQMDVDMGLVSAEYASTVRGYPAGEAAKAQEEKAARLARQNAVQQPTTKDNQTDPNAYRDVHQAAVDNGADQRGKAHLGDDNA